MAHHTKKLAESNNELVDYTSQLVQDNRDLVESNLKLVDYTHQANERAEKLFVGQNKPFIDVTPIGIIPGIADDGNKMCATLFSVLNYSGFDANNVGIDIAYEGIVWISEWLKADNDRKEKEQKNVEEKGVIVGHLYPSRPKVLIPELKSGEAKEYKYTSGSLDLEERVCGKGKEGFPVLVRVTWQNDRGHVFDEIHKYKLLCTTVGFGRAFTFIPEGIISQKN